MKICHHSTSFVNNITETRAETNQSIKIELFMHHLFLKSVSTLLKSAEFYPNEIMQHTYHSIIFKHISLNNTCAKGILLT